LLLVSACGTPYQPEEEEPEEEEEEIPESDEVPPDPTLETVTWNLNWYGDGTYGSGGGNGPPDEQQQTQNIIQVTDSLKADLYAFQEVYGQEALNDITENMSGYRGFIADHISWIQKTAFVYNTNTIDSLSAGAITDGQNDNAWAGRFPLYFQFTYSFEESSYEFYAIVIHAKAFDDQESYQRRKTAAQDLYNYLINKKPDANIVFLGDYNDDVDESIYEPNSGEPAETPYQPFVANSDHFQVITEVLSNEGKSSTVGYPDMIDHITMSNELYSLYVDESATVFQFDNNFIENFGETTSDHYPVWAKFDVTKSKSLANK
jgi:endonuclease/exonuclease/phosphatase family metal-dependent hydrolase